MACRMTPDRLRNRSGTIPESLRMNTVLIPDLAYARGSEDQRSMEQRFRSMDVCGHSCTSTTDRANAGDE